ncbi:MAG: hypothetical protein ACYTFY_08425 [Planctomycetota bacterium]|jgi:hypothetical protein
MNSSLGQTLKESTESRFNLSAGALSRLYCAGRSSLTDWLNEDGIDNSADLRLLDCQKESALAIGRPLRLLESDTAHTIIMRILPIQQKNATVHLWTQRGIGDKAVDCFQSINGRVQNQYDYLRHLPGVYDLDSMTDEEVRACGITGRSSFSLPENEWSTLVVTWGAAGYDPQDICTRVFINGICITELEGSLRFLHTTRSEVMRHFNFEAISFWERDVILCGLNLSHYAEISQALHPDQAKSLSRSSWSNEEELLVSAGKVTLSSPDLEDIYACAPGSRIKGVDCLTKGKSVLKLFQKQFNRHKYWHADAGDSPVGSALFGIEDGIEQLWTVDIQEDDDPCQLMIYYQMLMPPAGREPKVSVSLDGISIPELQNIPLPATTASGPLRPEEKRYRAVPIGQGPHIKVEKGRHTLGLTFSDSNFIAIAELLLTPWSMAVSKNFCREILNYSRPPFMEVRSLNETDASTIYVLRFHQAESFPVSGELRIDDSCLLDSALTISMNNLRFQNIDDYIDVTLSVPASCSHRHLQLVFTEKETGNAMVYHLRHRRPFSLPRGNSLIMDPRVNIGIGIVPEDRKAWPALVEKLRNDPQLKPWLEMSIDAVSATPPPLKEGHHCLEIELMTRLLILTEDEAVAQKLKAILLAHACIVMKSLNISNYNEERMDVCGGYASTRRGGIFGEIHPYDIYAIDTLLNLEAINDEELLMIEGNLIWSGIEQSKRLFGSMISRGQAHGVIGIMIYAQLTGDEELAKTVERTMIYYVTRQMLPDGSHNEKISSYGSSFDEAIKMGLVMTAFKRPAFLKAGRETIRKSAEAFIAGCFSNGALLRQGDGGVQRGYPLFFKNGILTKLALLFPDMEEELKRLSLTFQAQLTRAMAKHNHDPVESWPVVPRELLRTTDLLPEGGWTLLRSAPGPSNIEASLDWSATGDHGHPDKLNMNLFAFDEVLTDDLSYGFGLQGKDIHKHRTFGYAMRSVSHNLVVADRQCQLPGAKGTLRLFDNKDFSFAWADAGKAYHGDIQADRCVINLGEIVIDLIHMKSGEIRNYDYMLHCFGSPACSTELNQRGPLCSPARPLEKVADYPGYDHLNSLKEGKDNNDVYVSFKIDGYCQMLWLQEDSWMEYPLGTLHMQMLAGQNTGVIMGEAPFPLPNLDSTRPFLMVSRQCRETIFAAVYQARQDNTPLKTVSVLPVVMDGITVEAHEAIAVLIEDTSGSTLVFQRHIQGSVTAGPIEKSDASLIIMTMDSADNLLTLSAYEATYIFITGMEPVKTAFPETIYLSQVKLNKEQKNE